MATSSRILVRYQRLDAIDHENVDGAALRIQPEPELRLQRGEYRGCGGTIDLIRHSGRRRRRPELRRHFELDVEVAAESGAIDHRAAHRHRQELRERVQRDPAEPYRAARSRTSRAARRVQTMHGRRT